MDAPGSVKDVSSFGTLDWNRDDSGGKASETILNL